MVSSFKNYLKYFLRKSHPKKTKGETQGVKAKECLLIRIGFVGIFHVDDYGVQQSAAVSNNDGCSRAKRGIIGADSQAAVGYQADYPKQD